MDNIENNRMSNKDFCQIIITTLIFSLLSIYIVFQFFILPKLEQIEQSQISKVLVVDFFKIASKYPLDSSSDEIEKLMVKVNDAIFQYKKEGFIIIDSSALIGYPDELRFPYELVLGGD